MTAGGSFRDQPNVLSVSELFDHTYRVPMYQRAYAWTSTEIHTLLVDIRDARIYGSGADTAHATRDYYIGSLVVDAVSNDDGIVYEVVDGQQRLTTLYIILALTADEHDGRGAPHHQHLSGVLTYEGRDAAGEDLRRLARDGSTAISRLQTDGIKHAAELVEQALARAESSDRAAAELVDGVALTRADTQYLLDHVKILRAELPPGTDLNHYFEVMNTRGEQLEKHEILKANLLGELETASERDAFSWIWDACSVLDRHIQTQFSPSEKPDQEMSERSRLFGPDWSELAPRTADELFADVRKMSAEYSTAEESLLSDAVPEPPRLRLLDVLAESHHEVETTTVSDVDPESGSYGSIIDFPNLLLHVLRIKRGQTFFWDDLNRGSTTSVRLEDKYLLAEFKRALGERDTSESSRQWVHSFAFLLLKSRYLLDTYVIRTQSTAAGDDEENWVLHRAFRYTSPGRQTPQLSARSTFRNEPDPRTTTKDTPERTHRQVLMLQAMFQVSDTRRASKYFLFQILEWLHRHERPETISGASFVTQLEAMARSRLRALDFHAVMHEGTHTPNFLFNILDYELWRLAEVADGAELARLLPEPELAAGLKKASSSFRFRYRTSVEHFYPVQPTAEQDHRQLDHEDSNSFGNLCLMSRSENSRRNNLMPIPKAREFKPTLQSLKFQLMSDLALGDHDWEEVQIHQHGSAMLRVLQNAAGTQSCNVGDRHIEGPHCESVAERHS